jgi:hypothetical protein
MSKRIILANVVINFAYHFVLKNVGLISLISFLSWENLFIISNWGWFMRTGFFLLNFYSLSIILNHFYGSSAAWQVLKQTKKGDIILIEDY